MYAITDRGIELLTTRLQPQRRPTRLERRCLHDDVQRLATDRGAELYRRRQPMIEPVFGQMRFNRRIDRFHRRGRHAARTEWPLITATHNLLKLYRHGLAALPA